MQSSSTVSNLWLITALFYDGTAQGSQCTVLQGLDGPLGLAKQVGDLGVTSSLHQLVQKHTLLIFCQVLQCPDQTVSGEGSLGDLGWAWLGGPPLILGG